jgi:protein disulfide-isomerase A6
MKFTRIFGSLLALATSTLAFYTKEDPILEINPNNWEREVIKSDQVVLAEFYAPWCGHCRNLAPQYKKAAEKLKGLAKVVAVNCDEDTNKRICGQMGIQGFPTVKVFHPTSVDPTGVKPTRQTITDYQGPRSAKPIVDFVLGKVIDVVKKIHNTEEMDAFINDTTFTRAILFTNKMKTPILFQSLALQYSKRILLGEVKDSVTEVVSKYNIEKFPSVVVFNKDTTEPIVYDGIMKHQGISEFFDKYAPPATEKVVLGEKPKPFDPKVPEITTDEELKKCIEGFGTCAIAVLAYEEDFEESVKQHKEEMEILETLKKNNHEKNGPFKFAWINGVVRGKQFARDFDLPDMFPSFLIINGKQKIFRVDRGAFDVEGITDFLKQVRNGRGRNFSYTKEPVLDIKKEEKKEDAKKDEL